MKEPLVKDGNRPNCPLLEYTLNVHNVFVFLWASFSFIFGLFRQTLQIFTTNVCEKCPCSIWHRDSNPRPQERESPPLTTRPGLPPSKKKCLFAIFKVQTCEPIVRGEKNMRRKAKLVRAKYPNHCFMGAFEKTSWEEYLRTFFGNNRYLIQISPYCDTNEPAPQ